MKQTREAWHFLYKWDNKNDAKVYADAPGSEIVGSTWPGVQEEEVLSHSSTPAFHIMEVGLPKFPAGQHCACHGNPDLAELVLCISNTPRMSHSRHCWKVGSMWRISF